MPRHTPESENVLLFKLWTDKSLKVSDIAVILNIAPSNVSKRAKRLGLPHRSKDPTEAPKTPKPSRPEPVAAPTPVGLIGDLIASQGKWRHLSVIATKHGMTMAKVQQEYHRARAAR